MKKTFITLALLAVLSAFFISCESTGGHKKACCQKESSCCEEMDDCCEAKEAIDCCEENKDCCEDAQQKADELGAGCCG